MTPKEFVVFVRGFISACGENSPTAKQWETLVSILGTVKEETGAPVYRDTPKSSNPYMGALPDWLKGTGTSTTSQLPDNVTITNTKK